jgi:hypothetical protein
MIYRRKLSVYCGVLAFILEYSIYSENMGFIGGEYEG